MRKLTAKIIYGEQEISINDNIVSIDIETLDRGSLNDIVGFGIYSNRGEITFIDIDNEFERMANLDEATLTAKIFLSEDTTERLIATFFVDDHSYNRNTKEVSLILQDGLTNWQNINIPRIFLYEYKSAKQILDEILSQSTVSGIDIRYDAATLALLETIHCNCPDIKADTLWNDITKICQMCLCRVFTDEQGVAVISRGLPNGTNAAILHPYNILGIDENYRRGHTKRPSFSVALKDISKEVGSILQDEENVEFYRYQMQESDYSEGRYIPTLEQVVTDTNKISTSFEVDDSGKYDNANISFQLPIIDTAYCGGTYRALTLYLKKRVMEHTTYEVLTDSKTEEHVENHRDFSLISTGTKTRSIAGEFTVSEVNRQTGYPYRVVLSMDMDIRGGIYVDRGEVIWGESLQSTNVESIDTNELMQDLNWVGEPLSESQVYYSDWLIGELRPLLVKGIECYSLTCTGGNYYDSNGNLVIDYNNLQTFSKYDTITPYIVIGGIETPLSIHEDGSPKTFEIIGVKYSYRGILRQKLYLQEIPKTEL